MARIIPAFFAMGSAVSFVAEKEGQVVGAVSVAIRPLRQPDGTPIQAAYVGDLKVIPARGTRWFFCALHKPPCNGRNRRSTRPTVS